MCPFMYHLYIMLLLKAKDFDKPYHGQGTKVMINGE